MKKLKLKGSVGMVDGTITTGLAGFTLFCFLLLGDMVDCENMQLLMLIWAGNCSEWVLGLKNVYGDSVTVGMG